MGLRLVLVVEGIAALAAIEEQVCDANAAAVAAARGRNVVEGDCHE